MGMRRNIALAFDSYAGIKDLKQPKIYFYTHWYAESLQDILADALKFGQPRWEDYSYIARIIFSRMIQDDVLSETGFGISPYPIDEEFPTIEVDLVAKTVNKVPYADFLKNPQMFAL